MLAISYTEEMHANVDNGASSNAKQDKGKEKEEGGENIDMAIEELETKIWKDKMLLKKMKLERIQSDNKTPLEQLKRKTMARAQEGILR